MNFFESTPVGRIVNRFNKDLEAIEIQVPSNFKQLISNSFDFTCAILMISFNNPYIVIVLIPILIIYHMLQVFVILIFSEYFFLRSLFLIKFFKEIFRQF